MKVQTINRETKAVESGFFKMNRWHCYWLMLIFQAPVVAWITAALVAVFTIVGFIVSPWVGVATLGFDVFFFVMALTFVIAVYGFHSITGCNTAMHSLKAVGEKVVVTFEDEKTIEIEKSNLCRYHVFPGGVLIPVDGARQGWLWLTPKAFESDIDMQIFLKEIYEGNTG